METIVWLGMNSTVLKGARIPDNSVVGAKSALQGVQTCPTQLREGSILEHQPSLFKSGIAWDRRNPYDYDREVNNENS